jgi:hypothetical protein
MIENGYETALVFEDDITLAPNFMEKLHEVLEELPPDWDYVNIGTIDGVTINDKKFSEHLMIGQALTTHAYIIHLRCAEKWAYFDSKLLRSQIDDFISSYPSNNFHVKKGIADQKGKSTIGDGLSRTHAWEFHVNKSGKKWVFISLFVIFLFLVRNIIIKEVF